METKLFSTKTERRIKTNPGIDGVHILGLDMGYSGPKGFCENGNFIFPNFCKKITGELFGDLSKNDMVYEDVSTGEKFFVGAKAVKDLDEDSVTSEDSIYGRNHYLDRDFRIIYETALGLAFWDIKTDGSDVFLQTGLPPEYLKRDEHLIRSVMEGRHQFALTIGNEKRFFDINLTSKQVDVMMQPMGTYYSLVIDNDGNIKPSIRDYSGANLLVFDGGFGTLDTFLLKNNDLKSQTTNPELGMRRVLDETRKLIEADLGVVVSIPAMQNVLKRGKVRVTDYITLSVNDYEIDEYLKKANEIVREEALMSIRTSVPNLKYLIMTGGTGAAWFEYFKERLNIPGLTVLSGGYESNLPATYANARGYYMFRLNQEKLRKRG